jgi:aspartyl-tRNA(Asn)/glutamyl-tRNA(Gln) amidotransferase subunit A
MDFQRETVAALASAVRAGELSAREVVQHSLDRIDALNGAINAFVRVDAEAALAQADEIDGQVAEGDDPGPLAGIPLAVKDLEDAIGFPTTFGSPAYADAPPATTDSVLVARLRAAGAVVVGKTNTPEFGWTSQTDNALFGPTRNPWELSRTAGGSSGGSGAAIASGMVPLATGSDAGGSIRIPSALCGISGFKPSLGRVPSGGATAPGMGHLSTRGPMARRTSDIAYCLDAVIGPDPTDLRSLPMPEPSWVGAVDSAHVPMKVAWSPTLGYGPVDREVVDVCHRALDVLSNLGADVVEIDGPFDADPIDPWLTIVSASLLRILEPFRDSDAWQQMDPVLLGMLEMGAAFTAVDYVKAEDECHHLNLRLVELFHDCRLLVTPTTAAVAPRCGEAGTINGSDDYNWVKFTYPFNMTRSPAGTICAGITADGLPVGLQMIGPQHGDMVVLRAMAALEVALADQLGVDPVPALTFG